MVLLRNIFFMLLIMLVYICHYCLIVFLCHGYLPFEFIKTAIVPIIKSKTANSSDKNNYRPIALVTAYSKKFKLSLLEIIELYLDTHDNQSGFKKQHSTARHVYIYVKKCD